MGTGLHALKAEEKDGFAIRILKIGVDLHAGWHLVVGALPAAALDTSDVDLSGGHCEMTGLSAIFGLFGKSERMGLNP